MSIAKVVVPMVGGEQDATVLGVAIAAARPFHAHVVALFVRPDPVEALPYLSEGVSGGVVEDVVRVYREASEKAAANVRDVLATVCARDSAREVPGPEMGDVVTVSYREVQGGLADTLVEEARLADLVVFAPLVHDDPLGLTEALERVLVVTDRPVLIAGNVPSGGVVRKIAVGWDGGTSAAQASSAALPYLERADRVDILSIQKPPADEGVTADLREYLALHGVESTERIVEVANKSLGETLLEAAEQMQADLLVMGGYGHGRLREGLFGGVTRFVVGHARIPIFLVH